MASADAGDTQNIDERTYQFEDEFVSHLRCIPMAVRRKLDLVGVKLKLMHWNKLPLETRQAFIGARTVDRDALASFRTDLLAAVKEHADTVPSDLPVPDAPVWQGDAPPPIVVQQVAALGVTMDAARWGALDELQRFALVKLCRPSHESDNLGPALREFNLL